MRLKNKNLKIGSRLKEIRKMNHIKVKTLADAIGVSSQSYYGYEDDSMDITVSVLIKLSKFYNMSIDDLVGNSISTNRTNATSFKNYGKGKGNLVIDQTKGDIFMYKYDESTIWYFLKTSDRNLGHIVMINENEEFYPAVIRHDEENNLYVVTNTKNDTAKVYKPNTLRENILVIGVLAGVINKEIDIDDFLK